MYFSYILLTNTIILAMVSRLDKSVGDILEALSKKNMLKNSVVVFISDNGSPNLGVYRNWGSNFPLRGVSTVWLETKFSSSKSIFKILEFAKIELLLIYLKVKG